MAEPKPAETLNAETATPSEESAPKLVAVAEEAASQETEAAPEADTDEPERSGVSWLWFGAVVLLLVASLFGLYNQTQRASAQADQIAVLTGEVEALGAELTAANERVQSYDMQLSLVRSAVTEVFQKMNSLQALVALAPADVASDPILEAPAVASEGGEIVEESELP